MAEPPDYVELRAAESGLVMVRGRIGGDGAPFNLGEATVTRATVRLASGEVGFAYVLGRDRDLASGNPAGVSLMAANDTNPPASPSPPMPTM